MRMSQVEHARGILRMLDGDLGENRELAVFNLENAIRDYEARTSPYSHGLFEPVASQKAGGGHQGPLRQENDRKYRISAMTRVF